MIAHFRPEHNGLDLSYSGISSTTGDDDRQTATNQAIRAANRLFFGRGVVAVILSAFFGFLWLQPFTGPTSVGLDLSAAFHSVAKQMRAGGIDPSGVLGAFGTIAIAAAVAMLESSRRLEALDNQRSSPQPGASIPHLRRNIHSSQLVSFVEFFVLAATAGFAAVLASALSFDGNEVLSIIAWLLCIFLVVCAWRFLLAFDFLDRLQFRPPKELLAARFAVLTTHARRRQAMSVTWWVSFGALVSVVVINVLRTPVHGSTNPVLAVLLCFFPLTAIGLCRMYGRAAVHETGVSRFATVSLTMIMATVWGVFLPSIAFLSAIDTEVLRADAAVQPATATAFLGLFGLVLLLGYRAFDQAGLPASWSSVGLAFATLDRSRPGPPVSTASAWSSAARQLGCALATGAAIGVVLEFDLSRPLGNAGAIAIAAFVYTALAAMMLAIALASRWALISQRRMLLVVAALCALGVLVMTASAWPAPHDARGTAALLWCAAILLTAFPTALAFHDESSWRTAVADYWHDQRIASHQARAFDR